MLYIVGVYSTGRKLSLAFWKGVREGKALGNVTAVEELIPFCLLLNRIMVDTELEQAVYTE